MVRFDDVHIADDYNSLTIKCHVEDYDVYENMYIKSVYLEYYKNRGTIGVPSSKAIEVYSNSEDDTSVKSVYATIPVATLASSDIGTATFNEELFYIYVTCDGTLPASVATMDCEMDATLDIAVVLDWKFLYEKGMRYIAALTDCNLSCDDPDGFESYILLWNALKFAADVCDWNQLERIWPKLVAMPTGVSVSGCGCRA